MGNLGDPKIANGLCPLDVSLGIGRWSGQVERVARLVDNVFESIQVFPVAFADGEQFQSHGVARLKIFKKEQVVDPPAFELLLVGIDFHLIDGVHQGLLVPVKVHHIVVLDVFGFFTVCRNIKDERIHGRIFDIKGIFIKDGLNGIQDHAGNHCFTGLVVGLLVDGFLQPDVEGIGLPGLAGKGYG